MTPPQQRPEAAHTIATETLREAARQRSDRARRAIEQAVRDLGSRRQPINVNAVARQAGVTRRTIYNHVDLLEQIRAQGANTRHSHDSVTAGDNPVTIASLRNELAIQKARYEKAIAQLSAVLHECNQALAAARTELQRLRSQPSSQP